MDARELRIGNFVLDDIYRRIESVHIWECELSNKKVRDYLVRTENIKPIPLTEEWLVKFGFSESKMQGDLILGPIVFYRKVRSYGCAAGESNYWITSGGDDEYYDLPVKLKYVHQLQNLYFALTGEEL